MPYRYFFILLLSLSPYLLFGQDDNDPPYTSETGFGANFNTNGGVIGGLIFKKTSHIKNGMFHYFAGEVVNVKHPKEQRYSSPVTGSSFIYFKQNYLFSFRGQYGREFLFFRKAEEEGVRVGGIVAGGISFGLEKPYAIDYDYTNYSGSQGGPPTDVRAEPYDPKVHTDPTGRILGTGGIFTGIGKTKIVPGLNLKGGLTFEFGNSTTGVEIGGLMEIFPRKIVLIPQAQNTNFFTSIYVSIYYASRR